jgi:hypothetical protein
MMLWLTKKIKCQGSLIDRTSEFSWGWILFLSTGRITQIVSISFSSHLVVYFAVFLIKNARNWAGVKIYIVALCWVGVTLVLPIINASCH